MTIGIAFDVLGTCFSLDLATKALQEIFGDQLEAKKIDAEQLINDLFHCGQRDFTYLSMNGKYTPIGKCLTVNLPKILLMAGLIPPPNSSVVPTSSYLSPFSPSLLAPILSTLSCMSPRPSLGPATELFKQTGGFKLLAATNGGEINTRNLFTLGLGKEVSEESWDVWSCDSIEIAKPDPRVYEAIWDKLVGVGGVREGWFVAAHTWDLMAAKKAGFKTAWTSYEEFITIEEIYGRPDIVATDLVDAAKQIIEWEEKNGTK